MIRIAFIMMVVAVAAASQDYGALVGTWHVKFPSGSKATYTITNDGKVNVLDCSWKCPTKHGVLSKSDKTEYPSSGGWYKIDKIHRDDTALYVREKDCKLELVYYSRYWKNGAVAKPGKRVGGSDLALTGTWDVKFSTGSEATYKITNDGKVNVLNCDWTCPTKHGVLSKSDKTKFPSSGGWYKIDKIHRADTALYVREKDCKLELVYYSRYWKNGAVAKSGKRIA